MHRVYAFDDFELDPARREIRRGGVALNAEPKVLDLILLLVEAEGRLVDTPTVTDALWPGVRVSRDALYRVVKEARALLGDDGRRQAVIRTLSGKGFRWVAAMEIRDDAQVGAAQPSLEHVAALFAAGDATGARRQALEIARGAAGRSDVVERARALVWASDLLLHGQVDREWWGLARSVLDALDAIEASDASSTANASISGHRVVRAELLSRQAYQLYWSRDHGRSREALDSARAACADIEAPHARAWIEMIEHMLCEGPERLAERSRHALRAVEHAQRSGVAQTEAWAREQVVHDAMEAGDLETVEAQARAIDLLAEEHALVWPERVRTMLQLHRGDFPAAERALQREFTRHGGGGAHVLQYVGGPLMWLRHERGRTAEILPLLRRFVAGGQEHPIWRTALARAELEAGDRAAAGDEYRGLAASGFRDVETDFVAPVTLAHLTALCREFGDAEDAAWLEARLAPYGGRFIVAPRATFSIGPADQLLGQLASIRGRNDEAWTRLESAVAQCERMEAVPAKARCERDLAELRGGRTV